MKYTDKDLENIAKAFNDLVKATHGAVLSQISVASYEMYFSETKYIDYNEKLKKFRVYNKYKGWGRFRTNDD